jgi:hypothetical protein
VTGHVSDTWKPCKEGRTLGTQGSERGIILRDEEHDLGARVTLEQGGTTAPYSITCGIDDSMCHTAFASDRQEADSKYVAMRTQLEVLLGVESNDTYLALLDAFTRDF